LDASDVPTIVNAVSDGIASAKTKPTTNDDHGDRRGRRRLIFAGLHD
jgi:hypothetical protein